MRRVGCLDQVYLRAGVTRACGKGCSGAPRFVLWGAEVDGLAAALACIEPEAGWLAASPDGRVNAGLDKGLLEI